MRGPNSTRPMPHPARRIASPDARSLGNDQRHGDRVKNRNTLLIHTSGTSAGAPIVGRPFGIRAGQWPWPRRFPRVREVPASAARERPLEGHAAQLIGEDLDHDARLVLGRYGWTAAIVVSRTPGQRLTGRSAWCCLRQLEGGRFGDCAHLFDEAGRCVGAIHHIEDRELTVHVQDPELVDLARSLVAAYGFAT